MFRSKSGTYVYLFTSNNIKQKSRQRLNSSMFSPHVGVPKVIGLSHKINLMRSWGARRSNQNILVFKWYTLANKHPNACFMYVILIIQRTSCIKFNPLLHNNMIMPFEAFEKSCIWQFFCIMENDNIFKSIKNFVNFFLIFFNVV